MFMPQSRLARQLLVEQFLGQLVQCWLFQRLQWLRRLLAVGARGMTSLMTT
jgi:hypothetical protein